MWWTKRNTQGLLVVRAPSGCGTGRLLGYVEYGDPAGPPLLYFHGHPGSRLEARFQAAAG
jgi:hypothetical protein